MTRDYCRSSRIGFGFLHFPRVLLGLTQSHVPAMESFFTMRRHYNTLGTLGTDAYSLQIRKEVFVIRSLNGKTPKVHPTAFVSEAAYVLGDVEIGENSSIWPGTIIRGDSGKITIGRNTNIQDNSVVHSDADSRIGDNSTIAHNVTWHGRILGDNCLVGNGATVNDGVEVGEFCIIAAGAVVLEETKIPTRTIVTGIPAKPRGSIQPRHETLIKETAEHYAERCKEYKDEGLE